jgi:hypothetical protein
METQRSLQHPPVHACPWQCALDRWRQLLAALRRWLGRRRHAAMHAPKVGRAAPRRRIVMHLHRTVVVDEIAPPPSPRLPAPAPQPDKENPHAQLPPQQS